MEAIVDEWHDIYQHHDHKIFVEAMTIYRSSARNSFWPVPGEIHDLYDAVLVEIDLERQQQERREYTELIRQGLGEDPKH